MKHFGSVLLMDIGTRKIRTAVVEARDEFSLDISHLGEYQSDGFNCGAVSDLECTSESISIAINETRKQTGIRKFKEIWVGHSGCHIRSDNIAEIQSIAHNRVVTERFENRMNQRVMHHVPADHYLLHTFHRSSTIDGITRRSAVGLTGSRLVSSFHLVYTRLAVINNIQNAFNKAGYSVDKFVFNGYAASLSVLESDEKAMGCMVIHIGSTTCDYIVYQEGQPFLCGSINEGWSRLAKDVAVGVQIPMDRAENLILSDGCTSDILIAEDRPLNVKTFFGSPSRLTRRHLAKILSAAADEILCGIRDNLKGTICRGHLPAGVILTGGGAVTNGLVYSAENVFGVTSRIGDPLMPGQTRDYDPSWAPVIGLIRMALLEFQPSVRPETMWEYLSYPFISMWIHMFPNPKDPVEPEGEPSI
ncbi:cell division protein FtsA [bacterium]|nr:cell division protein FtsA [candidate division CSSED10-310 bacterium]